MNHCVTVILATGDDVLRSIVGDIPQVQLLGSVYLTEQVLEAVAQMRPRVLVLAEFMDAEQNTVRILRTRFPDTRIVYIITSENQEKVRNSLIKLGIYDFLPHTFRRSELEKLILYPRGWQELCTNGLVLEDFLDECIPKVPVGDMSPPGQERFPQATNSTALFDIPNLTTSNQLYGDLEGVAFQTKPKSDHKLSLTGFLKGLTGSFLRANFSPEPNEMPISTNQPTPPYLSPTHDKKQCPQLSAKEALILTTAQMHLSEPTESTKALEKANATDLTSTIERGNTTNSENELARLNAIEEDNLFEATDALATSSLFETADALATSAPAAPVHLEPASKHILSGIKVVRQQVVAFWSGKSGTGKTTLAVNTALALARAGVKVVLVDGDIVNLSVGVHLNLQDSKRTLERALKANQQEDIDDFLLYYPKYPNLAVLSGSELCRAEGYYTIEKEAVQQLIHYLKNLFDVVIIDTATDPQVVTTFVALQQATKVMLVTNQDYAQVFAAKRQLALLRRLRLPLEKIQLVLNGELPSCKLTRAILENMLDLPMAQVLPYLPVEAVDSLFDSQPLVLQKAKSIEPYKKGIELLANEIFPYEMEQKISFLQNISRVLTKKESISYG